MPHRTGRNYSGAARWRACRSNRKPCLTPMAKSLQRPLSNPGGRVSLYFATHRCDEQFTLEEISQREAARRFGIDPRTVAKMLAFSVPPGYRRSSPPRRPKLDPFLAIIDQMLEEDKGRPSKQHHTAKRIFETSRGGRISPPLRRTFVAAGIHQPRARLCNLPRSAARGTERRDSAQSDRFTSKRRGGGMGDGTGTDGRFAGRHE